MEKTQLLHNLEAVCDVIDFDGSGRLVTWARAADGQLRVDGAQVAADGSSFVDSVAAPVMGLLCGTSWPAATAARWTHVFQVLRRFLIGAAAGRVLPRALENIRSDMNVHDGLEASLTKAIAENAGDFASKNKLRLLRFWVGHRLTSGGARCKPATVEHSSGF